MSVLEIKGINQFYGQSHILWDLNLNIEEGTCGCLLGRNGVGKTTLLKCITGLLPVRDGQILLNGQDITRMSTENRARAGIGYVPQGREIFPLLTVEENLKISLGARKDRARQIPAQIYELFPVLKEMKNRRGGDLSGGQQQQLAIGRALVLDPKLLILDEPTEGIQPNIVRDISDVIRKLNTELGLTVLLVEQIQIVQRLEAVEADADVLDVQYRPVFGIDIHVEGRGRLDDIEHLVPAPGFAKLFDGFHCLSPLLPKRPSRPTRPRGSSSVTSTNRAPRMNSQVSGEKVVKKVLA
jgi:urea transport system ATP-binding protein